MVSRYIALHLKARCKPRCKPRCKMQHRATRCSSRYIALQALQVCVACNAPEKGSAWDGTSTDRPTCVATCVARGVARCNAVQRAVKESLLQPLRKDAPSERFVKPRAREARGWPGDDGDSFLQGLRPCTPGYERGWSQRIREVRVHNPAHRSTCPVGCLARVVKP